MSCHIYGTDNLITDSSLSIVSGAANSQYPVSNLLVNITGKTFRSTGTGVEILVDTGLITAQDTFMVVGDNTVGLGVTSISIYGSATTNFGASSEIQIDLSAANNFGFKQFTQTNFRYWKIVLTGAVYCEISNIYLGLATEITTNAIAMGSFKYTKKENVLVKQNKYGNKFITKYNTQKSLSGKINLLNETELDTLREIFNDHKRSIPFWFITDPDDVLGTDSKYLYSGFFYFSKDAVFTNVNVALWNSSIDLVEVT